MLLNAVHKLGHDFGWTLGLAKRDMSYKWGQKVPFPIFLFDVIYGQFSLVLFCHSQIVIMPRNSFFSVSSLLNFLSFSTELIHVMVVMAKY